MTRIFFKLTFFLRSKFKHVRHQYRLAELRYLLSHRISFDPSIYFDTFPSLYFDGLNGTLKLNKGVSMRGSVSFTFMEGGVIEVGEGSFINQLCSFASLGSITIGKNCLFGEGVKVYDHNHQYKDKNKVIKEQGYTKAPVIIQDNCWIGSNVIILKGVIIGSGTVIGANCVIHKSIPAGSLVIYQDGNQVIRAIN